MTFLSWCKLRILARKLYHGPFGKYNRYRCWCLKRNVSTTEGKLQVAREVLNGPGVSTVEAQYNELYIRDHQGQQQGATPRGAGTPPTQGQPSRSKQA